MRILALTDVYFPRINGVSTSIRTFARELRALGHDYSVVAPEYPDSEPDAGLTRISSCAIPFDPEDRLMSATAILRQASRHARSGFDLIHVHTPFVAHYAAVILGRRLGLPVVETVHTHFEEYAAHYLPWLPSTAVRRWARGLTRRQCGQVSGVIVPSHAMRDRLAEYGVSTPMEVIPTGVDTARVAGGSRPRMRARLGIADSDPVLLFVGRVAHEKNIGFLLDMMVRVVAANPATLLVIAGEGPAEPSLRERARTLGLSERIRFLGYLSVPEELADAYAGADLFVFASTTETQGLVLLEAMAAGTPVVALAEMGTRDIVAPRRGARVPAQDPGDFADCVLTLLADPALRVRLGEEARVYAGEWSARGLAERIAAFYAEFASPAEHAMPVAA